MLEVTPEMKAAAAEYKRRIAGMFMLVEPKNLKAKLSGSDYCVTRKIDGVMAYCIVKDGDIAIVGTGGRDLTGVPVAAELLASVTKAGFKSATVVAELYVPVASGRPRVFDVLSALADSKKVKDLCLAPFDIFELNGEPFKPEHYKETHAKLSEIFTAASVKPVEMKTASSDDEVLTIYDSWIGDEGAEGLVVHSELPIVWKIKPRHSIDAVVVGFTTGDAGVRDLMFAVRHPDGLYQTFGASGNGLDESSKAAIAAQLSADAVESSFVQTDSRGIAFQMVSPKLVFEVSFGDLLSEDSQGNPKYNPVLAFNNGGWQAQGRTPGVSAISLVIVRQRDDKSVEPADVRLSQLSDICPFAERSPASALPKSTLLKRKVFKKESKGKVMLQKFVTWKTNKESDPRYPAYVFHYTDYSSGRKDPLKKDLRIAATEEQINTIFDAFLAENVKKGWDEV